MLTEMKIGQGGGQDQSESRAASLCSCKLHTTAQKTATKAPTLGKVPNILSALFCCSLFFFFFFFSVSTVEG